MLYDILISSHLDETKYVISDTVTHLTNSQIDQICSQIQILLTHYNIKSQDRIVIYAERTITTVLIILACIRMGVCFVPVSPGISEESLFELIESAEPSLIIGDFNIKCNISCICADEIISMAKQEDSSIKPPVVNDPIVYILYTSGSTGIPKGVIAEEDNVIFCIHAINKRLQNNASDRILCCLPLSFDYGLYQIFLALASGAYLILLPEELPFQKIISFLAIENITGFPAMPAMLSMLLRTRLLPKANLSSIRYITSTGDNLPVFLIQKIQEAIPSAEVIPMYGLTECKRVSIMPIGRYDKVIAGSCGLPLDEVKVWLDDKNSDGIGELIISGKNIMSGYWRDLDETKKYYFTDKSGKRCLRSGDFFKIDEDGFLYFISRKKDILKVNGYRIGIVELENKLYSEMKDLIYEIGVFGYPDTIVGERIAVCISTSYPTEQIIKRLRTVSEHLSSYQRPNLVYCTKQPLPKNINGKIDRKKLKEMGLNIDFVKFK